MHFFIAGTLLTISNRRLKRVSRPNKRKWLNYSSTHQYVAHICRTGSLVTPPVAIILTRMSSTSRSNMKFWLSVWHWIRSDMHERAAFFSAGELSVDWIRLIKRGTISRPNFCVFFEVSASWSSWFWLQVVTCRRTAQMSNLTEFHNRFDDFVGLHRHFFVGN